jgi:hypothetical protein
MRLASSAIAGLEMNALGAEGSGSDGSALDHQMQPDNDSAYTNDVGVPWCPAQKIEVTVPRYKKTRLWWNRRTTPWSGDSRDSNRQRIAG